MSFKEFVNAGAYQNTATTGYDNQFFGIGHSLNLPTPTLDIPTRTLEGTVRRINYTENPISIHFDSGTVWNLTKKQWDYLLSTNKEPRIDSKMQIEMYLDGTIKSVNITRQAMHGLAERKSPRDGRESNVKSFLGGGSKKPEKLFGKKHMPF